MPPHNAVLFKAYIGPRPVFPGLPGNKGKWDWFTAIGSSYAALPYLGEGSIAASLGAGGTTVEIDGITLPTNGGIWLGPGTAGQTWEYAAYEGNSGGVLASIERNIPPGNSGAHAAGAPAYFWYPLDTNDGQFELIQETSDNMAARTWTARIAGVQAPAMVLKPEHIIAITFAPNWPTSTTPILEAEDFPLLCLGFIERVSMTQNGAGEGGWSIDIVSTARLVQNSNIPPLRMGPLNIALQAEAEVSSALGAAWKLTLPQRTVSGLEQIDITEPQEDFGASNIVDDNPDTLWVSDGWRGPGMKNVHDHNNWASFFVYPPHMDQFGVKYLEIINHLALDITWYWIYYKYTYLDEFAVPQTRGRWVKACEENFFNDQGFETNTLDGSERRVVIAEHGDTFNRLFPSASPEQFLDASTFDGQDTELVRRLWWEGGALLMAWSAPANSRGYLIHWGDTTWEELDDAWEDSGTPDFDLPDDTEVIEYIPASEMQAGEVIRRNFANAGDEFVSDFIHHPGYIIGNEDDVEFVKLTIPEMVHVLREDIGFGTTEIFVTDGQKNPNVEGFSRHGFGGLVFIDDEIIPFTGKDYYEGKLTGCTVGRLHKAGTKVYARWLSEMPGKPNGLVGTDYAMPFRYKKFETATDAYPLEKMEWGRGFYPVSGDPRYPYIGNFFIRFSNLPDARTPNVNSFEEDWLASPIPDSVSHSPSIAVPNASINLTVSPYDTGDGFRPRSMVMQIREVRNEAGTNIVDRPRLNYWKVYVDRRYFNPDTWLDTTAGDGWANELLVDQILGLSGWWGSLFSTLDDETVEMVARQSGVTESDTAWRVAVDAAEYGNSIIWVRRNSRIQVRPNDYLGKATHTPSRTYTTADFMEIEIVNVRPAEVGQIRLTWKTGQNDAQGVAFYPDTQPKGTALVEIGPVIAPDQSFAAIMAQNHYRSKRFPYNVFAHLAVSDISVELGEIHQVDYDFLLTGEITRKILLVESVTQSFENGRWHTVIGYREVDREVV